MRTKQYLGLSGKPVEELARILEGNQQDIFIDMRRFSNLPAYANNAAAIAGGLAQGDFYRTGDDPDLVCVVH